MKDQISNPIYQTKYAYRGDTAKAILNKLVTVTVFVCFYLTSQEFSNGKLPMKNSEYATKAYRLAYKKLETA